MDLNQLLFRHQTSLMRANAARGSKEFAAHRIEAAHYEGRIQTLRSATGATGRMTLAEA